MRAGLVVFLIVAVIAAVAILNSLFIVNPTQQVLVLQFGEVKQAIRDPGLKMKVPLVQDVVYIDKRVLDLDLPAQEIIASDQKRLVVDAFTRYRIANPLRFYQATQGGSMQQGQNILSSRVQANLRAVLAEATFTDIVRDERPELMQQITDRVAASARDLGIEVVDVKIRRADLPEANSEAIYARMQTEREQEAREIRAQGQEAAQRVRAAADRTATVLRAEANRESEQIRGQGDGRRNAIYADAYSQDPEFFAFYRAMQAYEEALAADDTRLVLSPDADFFRYFNDPFAGTGGAPPTATRTLPSLTPPEGADAAALSEAADAARKAMEADVAAAEAEAQSIEEQDQSATAAAEAEAAAVAATNPSIGSGEPEPEPATGDTAASTPAPASDTAAATPPTDAEAATPPTDAEAATPPTDAEAAPASTPDASAQSDSASTAPAVPSDSAPTAPEAGAAASETPGEELSAAGEAAETAVRDTAGAVEGEADRLADEAREAASGGDAAPAPAATAGDNATTQ